MPRISRFHPARLLGCAHGITTLEFSLIVPVLLLLIMGIIEFSLMMFALSVMESATNITSRMGKTGYTAPGMSRADQIIANVANRTGGILTPALIDVEGMVYESLSEIGQPEPFTDSNGNGMYNSGEDFTDSNGNGQWDADMGMAGFGGPDDIVVYTVTYPWPLRTPMISHILGSTYVLTTRTVVKNEPF